MGNEVKDKIFDFVYEMALRDATMRKAYPWSDDDEERKNERKRIFKDCCSAKTLTQNYIDALLKGEQPDFYKAAAEIEAAFKEKVGSKFTFGNTQKLINMTVKYMYITAYQDAARAELREKFCNCHCPMDGIMVEKVIDGLRDRANDEDVRKILKEHEKNWRGFLRKAWSRISCDKKEQYELFQEIVKFLCGEHLLPIEYDYKEWNRESE